VNVTRRKLLLMAGLLPAGLAASGFVAGAGEIVRSVAQALRPASHGTSSTRCALCGGVGHTMLDSRCPAARKVV
jgi:hypothetical protein